jgi:dimethylhistidine N-methyltransferase
MTHDPLDHFGVESGRTNLFAVAAVQGLSESQKTLPCEFFYDARGSELFEAITALPEYYPTRTEAAILVSCADQIAAKTDTGSVLVEFGSGSSLKTEVLLQALDRLAAYVPIDVSPSALDDASKRLNRRFPGLHVHCVTGDFRAEFALPDEIADRPRLGFFPGSTIGNFSPFEAASLLRSFARKLGPGSRLIIGVDLRKDVSRVVAAYNDAAGVTAAFNLNLLTRANRELGANFDLDAFAHSAIFNTRQSRIEMHLVSKKRQTVSFLGRNFEFGAGETIHTENSHKYSIGEFHDLARGAGWAPRSVWTDGEDLFSVHELIANAEW